MKPIRSGQDIRLGEVVEKAIEHQPWLLSADRTVGGHGDLPIRKITKLIKQSGYDGNITVEFEGMEDCKSAYLIAMENVWRLWDEAK